MILKVKMIIMSHLSDVQDTLGFSDYSQSEIKDQRHRLNFAKFLLLKHPNTEVEVDPEVEAEEFEKKHPNL